MKTTPPPSRTPCLAQCAWLLAGLLPQAPPPASSNTGLILLAFALVAILLLGIWWHSRRSR